MLNYDLFLLLKEGNGKEFAEELSKTYDEELVKFQDNKCKYKKCKDSIEKISEKIFTDKTYCLNPEEHWFNQIDTKLKTDPKSLKLFEQYKNYNTQKSIYTERLMHLKDELRDMYYMLEKYNIIKDESKIKSLFD